MASLLLPNFVPEYVAFNRFDKDENQCGENVEIRCCGIPDIVTSPIRRRKPGTAKKNGLKGCGQRNVGGIGERYAVRKGNETAFGEFPWTVVIFQENSGSSYDYACSGSLIHPNVVMTAAHCVVPEEGAETPKFKVRIGEWDLQTENETLPHQDRSVVKIESHPDYYAAALFNNIALLILDSPFKEAENIGVVCLPPTNSVLLNTTCFVSGWGKDALERKGKQRIVLNWVDLPIVEHSKCELNLRKTRLGHRFILDPSFICAGGEEGKGTCEGFEGAPLVCQVPAKREKYFQAGIVSHRVGCREANVPGVNAHVLYLKDWIDEQLSDNQVDMTSYAP